MTSKAELQRWLNRLDDDAMIGVDEGGLTLVTDDGSNSYIEIGGMPEGEEE